MIKKLRKIVHEDMQKEQYWRKISPLDYDFVYLLNLAIYVRRTDDQQMCHDDEFRTL